MKNKKSNVKSLIITVFMLCSALVINAILVTTVFAANNNVSLTISANVTSPSNANIITYTFTFGEPVQGFDSNDITVTNGTKGTFSGSGNTYTLTVNYAIDGNQIVSVDTGACTSVPNGNSSSTKDNAAATKTTAMDRTAPTAVITPNVTNPSNANSVTYTFTFSEIPIGFDSKDIQLITNGGVSAFSGSGTSYTLTVNNLSEGPITIYIPGGSYADSLGNSNNTLTDNSITIDRKAPTVVVSATTTGPTNANSISYTFKFSESVTGFALGDINLVNGTAGTLSGSGDTYTLPVTYVADGAQTVSVSANVCTDAAGNSNKASNIISITIDRTAPTLTLSQDGTTIVPTAIDSNLDGQSYKYDSGVQNIAYFAANGKDLPTPFTISANGTYTVFVKDRAGNGAVSVISVIVTGSTISLNDAVKVDDVTSGISKMYFLSTAAIPTGYKIHECGVVMSKTINPDFNNKDSKLSKQNPTNISSDGNYRLYALYHVINGHTINVMPYIIYEDTANPGVLTPVYYGNKVVGN